jgi:hypothetical protein
MCGIFFKNCFHFLFVQMAQAEAIILNIDESTDLMSDRRQDGNKVSLDVTGYVVQYKLVDDDWDAAEEAAFDRSKRRLLLYSLDAHHGIRSRLLI